MEQYKFNLMFQPESYQLTIHLNNLFTYWKAENQAYRVPCDRDFSYTTAQIISTVKALAENPMLAETYEIMRDYFPLQFRIAHLIQSYSAEYVKNYVNVVYGTTTERVS